jgi:HEAT repeat protein/beta-lactamase regulating signal transducer with metallopeptidase domain
VSGAGPGVLLAAHGAAWVAGALLKGTVLLLGVFLAAGALKRASAALRHLVWGGGIAAAVVLPLLSLLLPWRLPVVRLPVPVAGLEAPAPALPSGSAAPRELAAAPSAPGPVAGATRPHRVTAGDAAELGTSVPAAGNADAAVDSGWSARAAAAAPWLLALWLAGVLVVLARLGRGALVLKRELRRARPLDAPDWARPLVETADRLGLAREPRLLVSDRVLMPFVCGPLRPAVVLPAAAGEWSQARRRAVLCHELAHVRRFDLAVTILSRVGCALYWFHPLFWVAARRLRLESERACDDLVLGLGTRASEYADHLFHIACSAVLEHAPAAALPMAERSEFEGRVLAILEKDARRAPPSARLATALAAAGLAVVLPLAALGAARAAPNGAKRAESRADTTRSGRSGSAPLADGVRRNAPAAEPAARRAGDSSQDDAAAPVAGRATVERAAPGDRARSASREPETGQAQADAEAAPAKSAAGDTADPRTVAALLATLEDSVAEVRRDAAYALGHLEAASAVAQLGRHVQHDADARVREMAAWALGEIESRQATLALLAAARGDSSEAVRATAVWALGRVEDTAAVPGLAAALRDPGAEVRRRAAWALGSIEPDQAPPALIAALRDPSRPVRVLAAWALGRIGDPAAAQGLAALLADSAAETRHAASWALGRTDAPAARQVLIDALKNPDPAVRSRAARALAGSDGDPWPWPWPIVR